MNESQNVPIAATIGVNGLPLHILERLKQEAKRWGVGGDGPVVRWACIEMFRKLEPDASPGSVSDPAPAAATAEG